MKASEKECKTKEELARKSGVTKNIKEKCKTMRQQNSYRKEKNI